MTAPLEENTVHTLLLAVLELTEKVSHGASQAESAARSVSELRSETDRRHQENTREIKKIHAGITAANAGVAKVDGKLKGVAAEVSEMKPIVTRQRRRDEFHDTLLEVLRTSWGKITAGLAALGALIIWLDGHWPKVMGLLRKFGSLFALILALLIASIALARAQEHHDRHHPSYQNWVNKADKGCCNNQDCGELKSENERATAAGTVEVRIEGQWCPVLPQHYLKSGNAPDWSTAHVCVAKPYRGDEGDVGEPEPPCARLLCYQPKPGA